MQKARGQALRSDYSSRHSPPTACRHTVSGTFSLPSQGCFSPFPHGTGSLSVRNEYLALRDGPRGFKQCFTCPALLRYPLRVWIIFAYAPVTLYGSPFQRIRLTTRLVTLLLRTLQPRTHRNVTGLGYSEFARHYYRNRGFFLFLQVLRWFTSLSSLVPAYVFSGPYGGFAAVGFPIRKSPDITPVCGSPELIAACHVLHRLFLPRHPPCALSSLNIELTLAQELHFGLLREACLRKLHTPEIPL